MDAEKPESWTILDTVSWDSAPLSIPCPPPPPAILSHGKYDTAQGLETQELHFPDFFPNWAMHTVSFCQCEVQKTKGG